MLCCNPETITVDNGLKAAKTTLELFKEFSVIVPIPYIDSAIEVLISLIDKLQHMRANHESVNTVSKETERLVKMVCDTLSKVKERIEQFPPGDPRREALVENLPKSSGFKDYIHEFFKQLKEVKKKAEKLDSRPWWLRWIFSSDDSSTLMELEKEIVDCREELRTKCLLTIDASVDAVLHKLSRIEDEQALNSLRRANASYRAAVVGVKTGAVLPGMHVELFKEIGDWVEQWNEPSSKAICILIGEDGTGKSSIARTFARSREAEQDYGASFFFVRGEQDRDSTQLVFPTLAYQLARSQDAFYLPIVEGARGHGKYDEVQQLEFQATGLIHEPIRTITGEHGPVVLVIDALDKCSKDLDTLVPEMLDLLIESVRLAQFPLRIFITSRPEPLVEQKLIGEYASLVHKVPCAKPSPESIRRDMGIVVRHKLDELPSGQSKTSLEQVLDVTRLTERAGPQFVYAEIAIDFLHDHPRFVENGLDSLLSRGSSTFAAQLRPLDDLYLTVLEVSFPSVKDKSLPVVLLPTLGNLAVLRNPVSLDVLEKLTDASRDDVCRVLRPIRAVVLFDEERPKEKVCVKHHTFSEFLLDGNRCLNKSYYDLPHHHHSRLVVQCIGALQSLNVNILQLPDRNAPKATIPDLAERLEKHVPEHVQYACAHWAAHLGDSCPMKDNGGRPTTDCSCWKIGKALVDFTGSGTQTKDQGVGGGDTNLVLPTFSKLQAWVEIMAYMGRLDTVTEALRVAQEHIKGGVGYEEVVSRLAETKELVAKHYSEIEECPCKVHGLIFSETA